METKVMDEVLAETNICGLPLQHRLRTYRLEGGGFRSAVVFAIWPVHDTLVLDRKEMGQLIEWCETRRAIGVVEEWTRRYRGWK